MKIKHCALVGALATCVLLSGCQMMDIKPTKKWAAKHELSLLDPVAQSLPAPNPPVTDYRPRLATESERENIIGYVTKATAFRDPDSVKFLRKIYIQPAKEYQGKLYYVCGAVNAKNGFGAYAGAAMFFMAVTPDLSKHYGYQIDNSATEMLGSLTCSMMDMPKNTPQ